jgi:RNA polymerase sigma-70 factor, ECF subfamily
LHSYFFPQFLLFSFRCDCLVAVPHGASIKAPQESEDLELIHLSQAGDPEAFGKLVTKYRAKILARLHRIVHNEHDARDLAQEGFLKAWHSIRQFEGRSSFYTWLYSITVNLAIESLRRKRRCFEVELNHAIPSSVPSPRANCQHNEIRQHINAALAQLSPEHRVIIVLKVMEDMQYQEIAKTLNVSVGTVMSRLFYGRKKLQSILKPLYNQIYESQRPRPVRFHRNKRGVMRIAKETPKFGEASDSSLNQA